MTVKERVSTLKNLMKEKHIDAYIVPSFDAHQSEYVADHWRSREWISGFTGSAGTAVITNEKNGLWTDGRYYIQAAKQLEGSGIDLFKMGQIGVPKVMKWLYDTLDEGSVVGFDGKVISVSYFRSMEKEFAKKNITLNCENDLIGQLWNDRPEIPKNTIISHAIKYAGKSRVDKINKVREHMDKISADVFLLSSLDDIAWLFNIRGNDVKCNPVVTSYALVSKDKAYLFLDKDKVSKEIEEELNKDNVEVFEYNEIEKYVKNIQEKDTVVLDPNKVNSWIFTSIPKECKIVEEDNTTTYMKAIKSEEEIKNLKNCHVRDGVAMAKFIKWLKSSVGKEDITEISASDKAESFRKEQENFTQISFDSIAGHKEHAAMMHYKATPEVTYKLENKGFLLLDSGAQYLDGTTDITRTVVLGELTEEEKRDYTLVLKSNCALSRAKFLYGSTGTHLDAIAREPLWQYGIDYKCGTGHGVGYFLNVHEGPHRISPAFNHVRLEEGMIITNEPGVYKEGKHGIRTENELLVVKDQNTEFGQFMKFEEVTYCPIDLDGIVIEMLNEEEKNWLNNYHKMVYKKLSPYLSNEENKWLAHETREI
ncbi:aminopeptidase P family protein [Haloimpatiens sp. FM7315]|uniref:aminopeptidase P family protein n=1 Tax=Haloimpatiens sp. FM7315 TaxID=3298609 RepID=UPI0035A2CDF9